MDKLKLRKARISDAKLLFRWFNDVDVRNNSFIQESTTFENHFKWFSKKINNSDTSIFILSNEFNNIGQIRIDYEKSYWLIDYSIDREYRGMGYGKIIIELLLKKCNNFKFRAVVKKNNLPSISVFLKTGFKNTSNIADDPQYFEYFK